MPENLPELRDIHLPDGVSMWPPAYGWWVVLAIALGMWGLIRLSKILYLKSKKRYAKKLLSEISFEKPVAAAAKMSEILRRVCISKYPQALSLSGKEWVDFLIAHSKDKISENALLLLQNAPYMPENKTEQLTSDSENLKEFCSHWIGENL